MTREDSNDIANGRDERIVPVAPKLLLDLCPRHSVYYEPGTQCWVCARIEARVEEEARRHQGY